MGCNELGDDLYNRSPPFYARPRSNPNVMRELFRLFAQIALSRKGPQDLPASALLLAITVVCFSVVHYAVSLLLPEVENWRMQLVVELSVSLVWYAVLLKGFNKPERFLQTVTAMFGYRMVLAPLWIGAIYVTQRFPDVPVLQFPAAVIGLAVFIWGILAGGYVLKAALEMPMLACCVLIILEITAAQLVFVAVASTGPGAAG